MSSLEHHYRRLLRWYPADHRRRHEDEMLGVLLASAEPGQERPGLQDRADLLLGAVEIRLSRSLAALTGGWRDALALVSVIAPLLLLGQTLPNVAALGTNGFAAMDMTLGSSIRQMTAWGWSLGFVLLAAVIAAAALRRARITAATLAWSSLGIWLWITESTTWSDPGIFAYETFLLQSMLVVTALTLTVGPGPAHGLELIGLRKLMILGVVSTATLILDEAALSSSTLYMLQLAPPVVWAAIGGLAMGRPVTRRAAVILAAPIYMNLLVYTFGAVTLTFLLPAIVFLVVAILTIRRNANSSRTPVAA